MSSTSKIVTATEGGYHLLKIEGYSDGQRTLGTGQRSMSVSFSVAGHHWTIGYYPNGVNGSFRKYVSMYLFLTEYGAARPVTARVKFGFASGSKSVEAKRVTDAQWACAKFTKRADLEKKHLLDDSFTVRCEIVVINEIRAVEPAPAVPRAFVTVPPSDLDRCLRGLLETGSGADATFEVAGERLAVHCWLLAARSPAFSAELLAHRGAAAGVLRVDKMDPRVFKALLCFIYTDSLSLPETTTKQEEATLAQHLLVAAHRYGLERLKLLSEERLCGSIDVGTAASSLALAERLGCRGLEEACFDFLGRSPANLKAVMASDGFEHLSATCPSVLKEMLALFSAPRLVQ